MVSELEVIGLKNEIAPWGHNFDPSGSSLTWYVFHARAHVTMQVWGLCDLPFENFAPALVFVRVHAAARGTCHVTRGAT